jgi:hypothetical protein
MGAATLVNFKRIGGDLVYRFTVPTVLAGGSSGEITMDVARRGIIKGITVVAPTSVDFDFELYSKTNAVAPNIDTLLDVESASGMYKLGNINIHYFNDDAVALSRLYFALNNPDLAHATGEIAIELVINTGGHND